MEYLVLKWLHILSSTLLFGTGLGSAFYMFFVSRTQNVHAVAIVSKYVVLTDWIFTTTTVVFQPLSGYFLASKASIPLTAKWLMWSITLYILAGLCWLPVVWIQIRMRNMALAAVKENRQLPDLYWRYLRIWTALGVPAFLSLVVVFYLMVVKPV